MNAVHGLTPTESAALTRRVTLYSVATAAVLVTIKIVAWLASGSVALLASTADSGLDLLASLTTFFAVRYAVAPPDAEHRYGHGKAEGFASLMQAGLVFASAALVAREAVVDLIHPHQLQQGTWAIAVMVVSTALTALLLMAQSRVLRQTASVAVSGDRAHYAMDLASNVVALIGIGVSAWLGLNSVDAVAALAIAALLLWGAVGVFREASGQLMDHELPDEVRAKIVELMIADRRLTDVHQLRTRASGPFVHMQMHVDLDPDLTLEAVHQVIVAAEKRVLDAFPSADIIIHADPRGRAEPHGGAFAETKVPAARPSKT
ncbi:cation diffusion facilitator family transporter [Phenylobacterium sp.]|jgi:cation diffusion facilitator family transporter|uniref:cation diffusion facilitator family transporter n=1 Tax=Phenylobacterium sp. TaxID=1871053 RepID=UPI002E3060C7|nr:cation diffusion facilitator family transporter [Phenylobacterium sp.]HEX4711357.1 cation diffusion facilitator family transporter [Phenylobacterium sp.]